jgi:hypothetical protein
MRFLVKVNMPVEARNRLAKAGSAIEAAVKKYSWQLERHLALAAPAKASAALIGLE